jgi:hypothetical protein
MCNTSKVKLALTAGLLGMLTAGAVMTLCGYGTWKRCKAAEAVQDERDKERMAGEGAIGGNAPAVADKA